MPLGKASILIFIVDDGIDVVVSKKEVGPDSLFASSILEPTSESVQKFHNRAPYPWKVYELFLRPSIFDLLRRDFPAIENFVKQEAVDRGGARPHNRYYLSYSLHAKPEEKGTIQHGALAPSWRHFIDTLLSNRYKNFITMMYGEPPATLRFAWHRTFNGCDVSPHTDVDKKLGTQIFYFNNEEDWKAEYGGDTLILGGLRRATPYPEPADFQIQIAISALSNQSLLFKRTEQSWHGVSEVGCSQGCFRNTFHAIAERR